MEMQEYTFDITSVKEVEGGWVVNNNMTVPNDPGNRDYAVVQKWIAEGGVPEPKPTPTLNELKKDRIAEIDQKTESNLDTHGVTADFDFGSGVQTYTFGASKSAKMNWTLLLNLARDCMDGKVVEADHFPRYIQVFPDESLVQLDTSARAFQFSYAVLVAIEAYRASGAVLKSQVAAATTVAELDAIVDNR